MTNLLRVGRGYLGLGNKLTLAKLLGAVMIILVGLALSPEFKGNFPGATLHLVQPASAQGSAEDYFQRGFAALRENPNEAISLFTSAIQLDPNHANAYFFRGIAYSFKQEYGPAFRDLAKAISLAPDNPSYYVTRASIYEKAGDPRRAQEDRQKAQAITESKR